MEGLRPITLRFRANVRKLILGSIGTPLDHLSVKDIYIIKDMKCQLQPSFGSKRKADGATYIAVSYMLCTGSKGIVIFTEWCKLSLICFQERGRGRHIAVWIFESITIPRVPINKLCLF